MHLVRNFLWLKYDILIKNKSISNRSKQPWWALVDSLVTIHEHLLSHYINNPLLSYDELIWPKPNGVQVLSDTVMYILVYFLLKMLKSSSLIPFNQRTSMKSWRFLLKPQQTCCCRDCRTLSIEHRRMFISALDLVISPICLVCLPKEPTEWLFWKNVYKSLWHLCVNWRGIMSMYKGGVLLFVQSLTLYSHHDTWGEDWTLDQGLYVYLLIHNSWQGHARQNSKWAWG